MLRDRLSRKEELLHDYEKDLGKLRQAEILLREKDNLLQDLEVNLILNNQQTIPIKEYVPFFRCVCF